MSVHVSPTRSPTQPLAAGNLHLQGLTIACPASGLMAEPCPGLAALLVREPHCHRDQRDPPAKITGILNLNLVTKKFSPQKEKKCAL